MADNDHAEDLYLKGLMAFNKKDYKTARNYWAKVLEIDPNHEKTRKGVAELKAVLGKTKKVSAKEMLQKIKQLYAAKEYGKALKLCETLVKRHPNNEDLQGLYKKIKNRYLKSKEKEQALSADEPKADNASTEDMRGALGLADDTSAEDAQPVSSLNADDQEDEVQALIKNGVMLYEIQDYEQALKLLNKALELDPNNQIVMDYISGIKAQMGDEPPVEPEMEATPYPAVEAAPPITEQPAPSADAAGGKASKEALANAYSEGLEFHKNGQYEEAMAKWRYILTHYPNHKDTRKCLVQTENALKKQDQVGGMLEEIKQELTNGNHQEAERLLVRLMIEAPDLEEAQKLKESIEERKRQINEIRSLEIEAASPDKPISTASEEEITKFFTPEKDGSGTGTRKITPIVPVKKKKKVSKKTLLLVALSVVFLGVVAVGVFTWMEYNKKQLAVSTSATPVVITERDWKTPVRRAEDFQIFAEEFYNDNNILMAYFAAQGVDLIASSRLAELSDNSTLEGLNPEEVKEDISRLEGAREKAMEMLGRAGEQLVEEELDEEQVKKVVSGIKDENYEASVRSLLELLKKKPGHNVIRGTLSNLQRKLAFQKLRSGELDEALRLFKQVTVLQGMGEQSRQHIYAINRFYDNSISQEQMDQWFFFFLEDAN